MLMMFVGPPVVRLATTMLVEAGPAGRLTVELARVRALTGAVAVPARPLRVSVPLVALMVATPPPIVTVLAVSVPPLILMVPAVPGVTAPVTAPRVRVLLTRSIAFVARGVLLLRLMMP